MDWIYDIFEFSKKHPLDFTQMSFWVFFVIVYAIFALIYKRIFARNLFLFLVSCFFYYKTSGLFVLLLIFSTITDFYFGRQIDRSSHPQWRKGYVIASVFLNLLVLSYFKYAYFFTDAYNILFHTEHKVFNYLAYWGNGFRSQGAFSVDEIILPVGISFYTFQTISYSRYLQGKAQITHIHLGFWVICNILSAIGGGTYCKSRRVCSSDTKAYENRSCRF